MHANLRRVAVRAFNLVLAKPVISSVMKQDSAAVRVDGDALVIEPNRSRPEHFVSVMQRLRRDIRCRLRKTSLKRKVQQAESNSRQNQTALCLRGFISVHDA